MVYLITSTNVKLFELPAAFCYTAYGIISNTQAIYQVKGLQVLAPSAYLRKRMVTYPLTVQQC